jgi:hypothetical protein
MLWHGMPRAYTGYNRTERDETGSNGTERDETGLGRDVTGSQTGCNWLAQAPLPAPLRGEAVRYSAGTGGCGAAAGK